MIWMRGMQKKGKRFHRGLAVLMSAILLAGQYSFPVRAEENTEMPGSEDRVGIAEAGNSVSAGDAGPAGTIVEYAGSVSGGDEFLPGDNEEEVNFRIGDTEFTVISGDQVELTQAGTGTLKYVVPDQVQSPRTHKEYRVTSIGEQAFADCESLESVLIPGGVKLIGYCLFANCRSLKSVQLQEGITAIEAGAFLNCESLESILIPGSVLSIGQEAFSGCKSMESAFMQSGITAIGVRAFYGCSNLKDVRLSDTVNSIGQSAFEDCESLESIVIPDSVLNIGSSSFYGCKNLKSVEISESITSIGDWVFYECEGLESIEIPEGVVTIGEGAFMRCRALKDVQIPSQVTEIADKAFCGCGGLGSIELPSSIKKIGEAAFTSCNSLQSLKIAVKTEEADGRKRIKPISAGEGAFDNNVSGSLRKLTFLTEDGKTELSDTTVPTLGAAWEAYRNVNDGDVGDNYWYGWYLGEAPDIGDKDLIHSVTIQVYIDNEEQTDHGRSFMLKKADEDTWVTDLTRVNNGIYEIYEVADVQSRAAQAAGLDTRVTVEVNGQDAFARVDYYTVTFYDGDMAYSDDTLQRQQTLLKGYPAVRPVDPVKEGVVFREWVTGAQEEVIFDFNREIQEKTTIYAAWTLKEPEGPDKPQEPETPEEPDKPQEPETPEEPDTPEGPDTPQEPETPEEPDTPQEPETPEEPDTPQEPDTPTGPDNKPEESSMPEVSGRSEVSDKPTDGGRNEPKTGDASHVEVYATIAMIAGMMYLLLYFADQERGMTEETKKELV